MTTLMQDKDLANTTVTDAIQEVCEQNKTEPEAIWEALEAKGIDATPGLIYQAFHNMAHANAMHDKNQGLAADDLALLGQLAAKAGGIEQLMGILARCRHTPS